MAYYDPFDAREEEAFYESEQTESRRMVRGWIEGIKSSPGGIAGIRGDLPIEASSLERLVEAVLSAAAAKDDRGGGVLVLEHLRFSHWGLGDRGVEILRPLLGSPSVRIETLSLPNCGITSGGFLDLLRTMATGLPATQPTTLDLSRNNLRCPQRAGSPPRPPEEVLFTVWLPRCTNLRNLVLSATGLNESWIAALLRGCSGASESVVPGTNHGGPPDPSAPSSRGPPSRGPFSLDTLDVSYNMDSLEELLGVLLEYLPRLRLRALVLTRGASSSTCIDADHPLVRPGNDGGPPLLDRLIQRLDRNPRLQFLGPIGMLPLDRQSSEESRRWHGSCQERLQEIRCFRLRRNRLDREFLRSLFRSDERPGRNDAPLPSLAPVLDATIGSGSAFSADRVREKTRLLASLRVSLAYHLVHETSCFWSQHR